MAITQNGAAVGELLSAALAKHHLGIMHDDDDALISSYVEAATAWIERTCGVRFKRANFTYEGDDFCLSFVGYADPSITSISYVDAGGNTQSITDFEIVSFDLSISDAPYAQSVTVVFDAGYATAPAHYAQAGLMLVAAFYEERANVSQAQTEILPFGVRAMISPTRTFAR